MKTVRIGIVSLTGLMLGLALGCAPRREVTERDRKEAAYLASEAQFAVTVHEWARAESLLAKAVKVAPTGDYWLNLGATRIRLNNRAGAKEAYQAALKAYAFDSARKNTVPEPWVKQAYVLALLGRRDESRAMIAKAAKLFPNDGKVRALTDSKGFEKMISSQNFKDMAL
jgi:tetratricopeptide (TPR) repeat protein